MSEKLVISTQALKMNATTTPSHSTLGSHPRGQYKCRATQLTPAWNKLIPREPVSLDIEFQNYKHVSWEKWRHRVGRVAIVNSKGETVLDVYAAYPKEDGVSKMMPPKRFMVSHQDLQFCNGVVPAQKVERWVKQLIKDRVVILHGGKHDLTAFVIETDVYSNSHIADMQVAYSHLQRDGTPGLKTAAAAILGESVQVREHSPVEDAQTALKLWRQDNDYDRDAVASTLATARTQRSNGSSRDKRSLHAHSLNHASGRKGYGHEQATMTPAHVQSVEVPQAQDAHEFPSLETPNGW